MTTPKIIETIYNGIRFRSRLEARWAVFMDALGIKWEYEPEGFTDGTLCYLPDFWLPGLEFYLEIKPIYPSEEEISKSEIATSCTNHPLIFGIGRPSKDEQFLLIGPRGRMMDNSLFCLAEDRRTDGEFWLCCKDGGFSVGPVHGLYHERGPILSDKIERAIFTANNYRFGGKP